MRVPTEPSLEDLALSWGHHYEHQFLLRCSVVTNGGDLGDL